ncbi:hypothetical protein [Undibacterium sp.]|jgi:hypothetical protein|uniref:hypothetical protein n=1 Tax=Undibacterium sp. TaxID=1914977 RepID=UPI002D14E531|nr:hypothetical protein [Undibacterium sp.]HTD06608.1 hypothetical protein [Undibacterium sp.]
MKIGLTALAAGVALTVAVSAVSAAPAAWYRWRSKFNDFTVCSQTSPGDGWEMSMGPFKDAQCSKPVNR